MHQIQGYVESVTTHKFEKFTKVKGNDDLIVFLGGHYRSWSVSAETDFVISPRILFPFMWSFDYLLPSCKPFSLLLSCFSPHSFTLNNQNLEEQFSWTEAQQTPLLSLPFHSTPSKQGAVRDCHFWLRELPHWRRLVLERNFLSLAGF